MHTQASADEVLQSRAYETNAHPSNVGMVPRTLCVNGEERRHPALTSGVFVVHGIGTQAWEATAAKLRSGFEDALVAIRAWQTQAGLRERVVDPLRLPAPFVMEGRWSDYGDLEATFPEEWKRFQPHERAFFARLWAQRTVSLPLVFRWILCQPLRLLHPRVLREVNPLRWLLLLPLQIIVPFAVVMATLRYRKVFTDYLGEVRLYLAPRGAIERAIVQCIDRRVGRQLLQMLGLGWDFTRLNDVDEDQKRLRAGAQVMEFERIVWVAQSLGTVISYNVLSDLLHRSAEILGAKPDPEAPVAERARLAEQKEGAQRFRASLTHFVTLGSPLEKVAFLYPEALRRWPTREGQDEFHWVNFYSLLDPVSGRLGSERLCAGRRPTSYHCRSGWIPGLAHLAYWTDSTVLRFIASRSYGRDVLPDQHDREFSAFLRYPLAIAAYATWVALLFGGAAAIAAYVTSLGKQGVLALLEQLAPLLLLS